MVKDGMSRLLAVLMLGLMALLVAPRDLLHHCGSHEHDALATHDVLTVDEDCAICQAVLGPVLPGPSRTLVPLVAVDAPEACCASVPAVGTDVELRVPRGPPARS